MFPVKRLAAKKCVERAVFLTVARPGVYVQCEHPKTLKHLPLCAIFVLFSTLILRHKRNCILRLSPINFESGEIRKNTLYSYCNNKNEQFNN